MKRYNGRTINAAIAQQLLATMWLCRAFEEKVSELIGAQQIAGLVHLAVGQESVAAGVMSRLARDDLVFSAHRAHGHALAKGADPSRVLAEIAGLDAVSLQPAAGAHGEMTALLAREERRYGRAA